RGARSGAVVRGPEHARAYRQPGADRAGIPRAARRGRVRADRHYTDGAAVFARDHRSPAKNGRQAGAMRRRSYETARGRAPARATGTKLESNGDGEEGGASGRARASRASLTRLLYDLIRTQQQRRRNGKAEGLGGLEVDDQLELPGLLHGKIGRLRPLENFVHIDSNVSDQVNTTRGIRHQAPGFRIQAVPVYGGQAVPRRKACDPFSLLQRDPTHPPP